MQARLILPYSQKAISFFFMTFLKCTQTHPESTKQMEEKLNFQVPSEGLELVILLHTQY